MTTKFKPSPYQQASLHCKAFENMVTLDLDDPMTEHQTRKAGGTTIAFVEVIENGKKMYAHLRAMQYSDSCAGKTNGVYLILSTVKRNTSTDKRTHCKPWNSEDVPTLQGYSEQGNNTDYWKQEIDRLDQQMAKLQDRRDKAVLLRDTDQE